MNQLLDGTRIRIYGDEREETPLSWASYESWPTRHAQATRSSWTTAMQLKVVAAGEGVVEAEVVIGGILGEHKGVNLPEHNSEPPP
jgi:hypothetical protein